MDGIKTINDESHVGPTSPDARQRLLLQVFITFVVIALVVAIAMFVVPSFGERLVPYYGWPVIGLFYASALKAAIPPLFESNPIPIRVAFRSIIITLCCVASFGAFTTLLGFFGNDHGNPYLTVTWWQPIWTILFPLGWISLFHFLGRPASNSH